MTDLSNYQWGPEHTPKVIFRLILWTSLIMISSELIQSLFDLFGWGNGPQAILSLTWWGITNWYLWQPITYLFVQGTPEGVSFYSLMSLFLDMYILWIMGSAIVDLIGSKSFLKLYFFSGIIAGILALLLMPLVHQYVALAGSAPSILALMTVWTIFHAELDVLLFFLIPMKAKWLIAGLIGMILIITFLTWNFIYFCLYLFGILFGYCYAICAWKMHGPFSFTHSFDNFLIKLSTKISKKLPFRKNQPKETKIFDIKTGQAIFDDDQFVDAMLSKISQNGEKSLTRAERRRLQDISEKKNKH